MSQLFYIRSPLKNEQRKPPSRASRLSEPNNQHYKHYLPFRFSDSQDMRVLLYPVTTLFAYTLMPEIILNIKPGIYSRDLGSIPLKLRGDLGLGYINVAGCIFGFLCHLAFQMYLVYRGGVSCCKHNLKFF